MPDRVVYILGYSTHDHEEEMEGLYSSASKAVDALWSHAEEVQETSPKETRVRLLSHLRTSGFASSGTESGVIYYIWRRLVQ